MKKNVRIVKRLSLVALLITTLIFLGGHSTTSGANDMYSYDLRTENKTLREEYAKLSEKLTEIEEKIIEIKDYNNSIYAQMLGLNFDTTDNYIYFNDSVSYALRSNDTIFSFVNERAFYVAEILATELTKLQETSTLFRNNKYAINYYPTISPIKTSDFICLSSPFGYREHPIKTDVLFHEGVDISARIGTPVHATAQGRVIKIMYSKYGYGNRITIQHAYGFETLYAHLKHIKVKKGQWVNKNQIIGTVGNTGLSTGSHLHYEIHKNGIARDPLGYFYVNIGNDFLATN